MGGCYQRSWLILNSDKFGLIRVFNFLERKLPNRQRTRVIPEISSPVNMGLAVDCQTKPLKGSSSFIVCFFLLNNFNSLFNSILLFPLIEIKKDSTNDF